MSRRARTATVHPVSSATPCSVTTASTSTRAVVTTPPRRVELIVDSPRDSERSAMTERAPVSDAAAQLRTLLALKLQEDFADFVALEKESNDLVVQQHYKSLLRHVFEVLHQLEVPLKAE